MKQVQFAAFGTPHEVAACVEVQDVGAPGPDEVVIEVEAFPINPADLLTITGGYAVRPGCPRRSAPSASAGSARSAPTCSSSRRAIA